ncbi:hypothetical protein G9A89_015067 [Geosiphon pyriformis]|nr:hypothetical protein G9A89_015067 [Geosiphon pyriformis]
MLKVCLGLRIFSIFAASYALNLLVESKPIDLETNGLALDDFNANNNELITNLKNGPGSDDNLFTPINSFTTSTSSVLNLFNVQNPVSSSLNEEIFQTKPDTVGIDNLSSLNYNQLLLADGDEHVLDVSKLDTSQADAYNLFMYAPFASQALCHTDSTQLSEIVYVKPDIRKEKIVVTFAADEKVLSDLIFEHKELSSFIPKPNIKGLKVNKGFLAHFLYIKDAFVQLFLNWMDKAKPLNEVILVGYSLGGVMATLGALTLTILIPDLPKPTIYTYGLPRIGDIPFAKYANEKVRLIRATITNDDVATAPHLNNIFTHWGNYYSHFGEEIWSDRVDNAYKTFTCPRKNGELESDVKPDIRKGKNVVTFAADEKVLSDLIFIHKELS